MIEKENTHARAQVLFAPTGLALRGQLTLHQSFQASIFQKLWGLSFKESICSGRTICLLDVREILFVHVFQTHELLKARCLLVGSSLLSRGPASSLSTIAQVYSIYGAGQGCRLASLFWSRKAETQRGVHCPGSHRG